MNTKLILFLTLIFQNDDQSWEGDFADYPVGEESFYELSYELSNLPTPLKHKLRSTKTIRK